MSSAMQSSGVSESNDIVFNLNNEGVAMSDWKSVELNWKGWNTISAVALDPKTGVIRVTPKLEEQHRAKWDRKIEALEDSLKQSITNKIQQSDRASRSSYDRTYQNTTGRSGARR